MREIKNCEGKKSRIVMAEGEAKLHLFLEYWRQPTEKRKKFKGTRVQHCWKLLKEKVFNA